MIGVSITTNIPKLNERAIARNASQLADEIGATVVNYVKMAITSRGAIASGKTLKSIRSEKILDSGSRGMFIRHVTGARSWLNIQFGRKAGKMPVRVAAGATRRGGLLFQPVPEMLEWFLTMNIPRAAWFPIMRKIAKNGVKPRDIRDRAVNNARPRIAAIINRISKQLAGELLTTK